MLGGGEGAVPGVQQVAGRDTAEHALGGPEQASTIKDGGPPNITSTQVGCRIQTWARHWRSTGLGVAGGHGDARDVTSLSRSLDKGQRQQNQE